MLVRGCYLADKVWIDKLLNKCSLISGGVFDLMMFSGGGDGDVGGVGGGGINDDCGD